MPYEQPFAGPGIKSIRRFYLLKSRSLDAKDSEETADVFRALQAAQTGTALPSTFPHLTDLESVGCTTYEDLDGATVEELTRAGLSSSIASRVVTAFAALIG